MFGAPSSTAPQPGQYQPSLNPYANEYIPNGLLRQPATVVRGETYYPSPQGAPNSWDYQQQELAERGNQSHRIKVITEKIGKKQLFDKMIQLYKQNRELDVERV